MRARDFDTELEVFALIEGKGEYGEITSNYESRGKIRADRVKNDGRKMIILGEQYPLYTAEFNIRDGNTVKEHWRVREHDSGTLYEIVALLRDREKRMITLKCAGVNPNGDDIDRHGQGN